ncbi:MAG TPA: hypothetical protein VK447_05080 [Myxococcaceae bacterium]|nr:hypothetical protein [Myxococcaceae bacterium]
MRASPAVALLLAFLAPVSGWAGPITLLERLPEKLAIDGELSEWTQPPSVALGAGDEVAGPEKVGSPRDLSARLWLSLTTEGLVVAGELTDDVLLFPEKDRLVNADHVEVWLAFPEAKMPPLGFANQFGDQEVPDAAACDAMGEGETRETCKEWLAVQKKRRGKLERFFTRQYSISPQGLRELWATSGGKPEAPVKACCSAASAAVVKKAEKGWRFEARIALEDLPATAQFPLRDVKVMVDLVDADAGIQKLETFLSSSAKRKLGRPETFNAVTLASPLRFESEPPLLEAFLKDVVQGNYFYVPGRPVAAVYGFENTPVGYQYVPSEPSPSVRRYALGKLEQVAALGDVKVYRGPSVEGTRLWSFKDGKQVAHYPAEGELRATAERPPGLHLLYTWTHTMNPLGAGACGACPVHEMWVVALLPDGKFKELVSEEIMESGFGDEWSYVDVTFKAARDFSSFGFMGTQEPAGESKAKPRPWKKTWRWDEKSKSYVEGK